MEAHFAAILRSSTWAADAAWAPNHMHSVQYDRSDGHFGALAGVVVRSDSLVGRLAVICTVARRLVGVLGSLAALLRAWQSAKNDFGKSWGRTIPPRSPMGLTR